MDVFALTAILICSVSNNKMTDSTNKVLVECYISSRSGFGFGAFSNLYNYPHIKKSFKVEKFNATYITMCNVDSIHEIFYFRDSIFKWQIFKHGESRSSLNKKFGLPRMELILHDNLSVETYQINSDFILKKDRNYFYISDDLKNFIIERMPCELRQDWLQDYTIE